MTADSLCFPMAFFGMTYRVVTDDFLTGFAMMTGSFTGLHVLFRMGGGVAGDVGSANVADGDYCGPIAAAFRAELPHRTAQGCHVLTGAPGHPAPPSSLAFLADALSHRFIALDMDHI